MHPNAGCAVGGKRVVEARALAHVVDRIHVVEKNPPQVFTRPVDPVNINVLLRLAVIRSHANHVSFSGDDIIQLVLAKESGERGVTLAFFFARLDGNREVILSGKAETQHDTVSYTHLT